MNLINQKLVGGKNSSLWVSAKECRGSLGGRKSMRQDGETLKTDQTHEMLSTSWEIRIKSIPIKNLECISSGMVNFFFLINEYF